MARPPTTTEEVLAWATLAARAADEKMAEHVTILQVTEVLGITDAFVIATGKNDRQIKAIVEEVEAVVKKSGGPSPTRIEGLHGSEWLLMDYVDFVVHVFSTEAREFYDLERLWADVPKIDWQEGRTGSSSAFGLEG